MKEKTETPLVSAPDERMHDLDALRGFAMLLGIALHAGVSFWIHMDSWPVQDSQKSLFLTFFSMGVHGFRMQLFFLLSGFFTAMLWRKRGLASLLKQRAQRVFVPLCLGMVTLVPLQMGIGELIARHDASRQNATAVASKLPAVGEPMNASKVAQSGVSGWADQAQKLLEWATLGRVLYHLWFLQFLCWMVAGFALITALFVRGRREVLGRPRSLILSPVRIVWLVALTMVPGWFMGVRIGADGSEGVLPIFRVLAYYSVFFGFGALLFCCDDTTRRVGQSWKWTLPVATLIVLPLLMLFGLYSDWIPLFLRHPFSVCGSAVYAWMMCFGAMGAARALCSRQSAAVRYLSDSSYWLYLAHLPLVVVAQFLVRDWNVASLVKYALVFGVVSVLLLISYQGWVRYSWLGTLLNGPRHRPEKAVV